VKETVLDLNKQKVGEIDLADEIFASEANTALLYEVVKMQRANKRKGCAATKTRGQIKGTTAKMYRQKGTGRARHGAETAPIFVGGGTTFGPHPRDYSYRIPRKARRGGLRSALALKRSEGKLLVVKDFDLPAVKTKEALKVLGVLGATDALIVVDGKNDVVEKSVRNLSAVQLVRWDGLNVYDMMRHEHVIVTEAALAKVQEVLKS